MSTLGEALRAKCLAAIRRGARLPVAETRSPPCHTDLPGVSYSLVSLLIIPPNMLTRSATFTGRTPRST